MWMFFGMATVGDPDRGVFLEIRPGDTDGEGQLTHLNLFEDAEDTGLVMLAADMDACFEALDALAVDLGADEGFLDLLEDDDDAADDGMEMGSAEQGWVWLDATHIFNVANSAVITIGDGEQDGISSTAVVYMTRYGGIVLYAGSRSDAGSYMFLLGEWLNASHAIGEVATEFNVKGDLGQRAKA